MNRYDRGDQPTLSIELLDQDGAPMDDPSITLTIRCPEELRSEGTVLTVGDLDHPETGTYEYALDLDKKGLWAYRWEAADLAEEARIYVRPGSFAGTVNL
jgi:hypothetical protein